MTTIQMTDEKKPPQGVALINDESRKLVELCCVLEELGKISEALSSPHLPPEKYCQLYAAQQALIWAFGGCAAAPFEVIMGGRVQPLMGTHPG